MNIKDLKRKIYEDNKIQKLLESLNCDSFKLEQNNTLLTCRASDSDNSRAVQIKLNEALTANIRNRGVSGDIISIVGYLLYEVTDFEHCREKTSDIVRYITRTLDYSDANLTTDYTDFYSKKSYNSWLKPIKSKRTELSYKENQVLDVKVLEQYVINPHVKWINEGISYKTQQEFGVGYCRETERIIFPIHNSKGDLVGVKGRYAGTDTEIESKYKYLYLIPCNKSLELFNYHRIKNVESVIVVEGAKSVMLLHQHKINAVSIEGDQLSTVQIMLLKRLGINVRIILAFDKDKTEEFIISQADRISNRQVYYLWDNKNLLDYRIR